LERQIRGRYSIHVFNRAMPIANTIIIELRYQSHYVTSSAKSPYVNEYLAINPQLIYSKPLRD